MGSSEGRIWWSVFDGVKVVPSAPEALMSEINSAIANLEYARATALLDPPSSSVANSKSFENSASPQYDAHKADEAYKAGCMALAAGKLDNALHSLNISLYNCPPDKASAVAKLQSLISLTAKQLKKSTKLSQLMVGGLRHASGAGLPVTGSLVVPGSVKEAPASLAPPFSVSHSGISGWRGMPLKELQRPRHSLF